MATYQSNRISSSQNSIAPADTSDTTTEQATYTLLAAASAGDILQMAILPAGCIITAVKLFSDALGSGTVMDVGLWNADGTAVNATAYIAGSTVGVAGGVSYLNNRAGFLIPPDNDNDRIIGVQIDAGAGTVGTVGVVASYRWNAYGG